MKVLLINPESLYLENDAAYPPMGLLYVAACFEREGIDVNICDLTVEPDYSLSHMLNHNPDLIGITCVTPNVTQVASLTREIPCDVPIMIGGAHPTQMPEDTCKMIKCDSILTGEAETVIPHIVQDLKNESLRKEYHGRYTPIETIPKPARHLVNLHNYRPGGDETTPIHTSRGCSFNCAFCSKMEFCTYRTFSIDRVIEEINDCVESGFKHVLFGDDNFILNVDRAKQLLKEISGIGIKFRLNQDARVVRDDVFKLASEAGCTDISFGIESGSQEMLDRMNKQTTVGKNEAAIRLTKEYGIKAKAYFMVNFPGETDDTVDETIEFVRRTRPDKWLLSSFVPLPGSDVFIHPEKYGITTIAKSWDNFYLVGKGGGFTPSFTTRELTPERQIELHDKLYRSLKEILG